VRSRHVSQVVARPPDEVYEFVVRPENLPRWAAGLASSELTRDGDRFVAESPMGRVTVRFAPPNDFGVLDHDVTLPSGATVNNPLRVLPHPDGAELVFTLRQSDMTDDEFDRDTRMIEADLDRLRQLLEVEGSSAAGGLGEGSDRAVVRGR